MKATFSSLSLAMSVGAAACCLSASPAAACGYDTFDGSICYTAANFCPEGFYALNGQSLTISQDQALYSLIGAYFGGDWQTTFNVPNLIGLTPAAVGQGVNLEAIGYAGKYGGDITAMSYDNMPAHTHVATLAVNPAAMTMAATLQAAGQTGTAVMPSAGVSTLSGISNAAKLWSATTGASPVALAGWQAPAAGGFSSDAVVVNAQVGKGTAFSIQSPGLGLTACIGSRYQPYPVRP